LGYYKYNQTRMEQAINFIDNIQADMGGTNIYDPLCSAID